MRAPAGFLFALVIAVACNANPGGGAVSPQGSSVKEAAFSTDGWKTEFSKHSVPLSEISRGGPGRDGIPPIDHPKFIEVAEADRWLRPNEPIIQFSVGEDHRAYPLQILIWHEIANDQVGGIPVTVTFCPLCGTAIAFDRRLDGRVLDFGTTGNLRNSDLVMWDRQTESWWQQVGGEAIVGELTGKRLTLLPSAIVGWETFRGAFPAGQVLSRETGFERDYGRNPYTGYDKAGSSPFLYNGKVDGRLQPKDRVVMVGLGGEQAAYPFNVLAAKRVIADSVGGQPIVVFFQPGTQSALDAAEITSSRDVGATGVFNPVVDGTRLAFSWHDGAFVDDQTGSRWNLLGRALSGPLAGKQMEPVIHTDTFWFAAAAFNPRTRIYR